MDQADSGLTSDNLSCRKSELEIVTSNDLTVPFTVRDRIDRGVPANTRRSYSGDWDRFADWCKIDARTPLPATEQTLNAYVDHLCDLGRSPSTIEHAIAVIRTKHRLAGYKGQPPTEDARVMLRGYKHDWADQGKQSRKATAAVVDSIKAMVATCDASTFRGLRDRSIVVLGFAVMARRSELSGLNIPDLAEADEGLEVRIRYSKTDQDAKGAEVLIPYGDHPETCPVLCTLAWVAALERRGITRGPLYLAIDRYGKTGHERAGQRAERLSTHTINEIVQRAARRADISGVSAHSLRAGGATSAAANGAPAGAIGSHGRWKSKHYLDYIRAADKWKNNPMKGIGL